MSLSQAIYMSLGGERFELCQPVSQDDFDRLNLDGTPRAESWKPIQMKTVDDKGGRKLATSDSPWLGSHALILRPKAARAMGDTLLRHGEILPLECGSADLAIYNVTRVLDGALDESASTITRFRDGRIMMIRKYVFRAEVVAAEVAFRISNMRVSPILFGRRFVEEWSASGLQGLISP